MLHFEQRCDKASSQTKKEVETKGYKLLQTFFNIESIFKVFTSVKNVQK